MFPFFKNIISDEGKTEEQVEKYNSPRASIRNYFASRKCFTFPSPVGNLDEMKDLENKKHDELHPKFREVANEYATFVQCKTKPKCVDGVVFNGRGKPSKWVLI